MKKSILFAVALMSIALFLKAENEDKVKSSSAVPEREGNTKNFNETTDENLYPNTALKALEARNKLINPILENIWNHPVNCEKIMDDEKAFEELKNIYNKAEGPADFIPLWDEEYKYDLYSVGIIDTKLERKIQEATEGHICFAFANRFTIKALAEIWEKYPCSEAAAVALRKINSITSIDYLSVITINNKDVNSYEDEMIKMNEYLIANYPNSWQAEGAKRSLSLLKYKMYSDEEVEARNNWIAYLEKNNLFENKYYLFSTGLRSPSRAKRNYVSRHWSGISNYYLRKCEEVIDNEIKTTGKANIPPEAIEMYNKHVEEGQNMRTKYPEYFKETLQLPRCYEMIRKHAPEHYKGDPPLRKKK